MLSLIFALLNWGHYTRIEFMSTLSVDDQKRLGIQVVESDYTHPRTGSYLRANARVYSHKQTKIFRNEFFKECPGKFLVVPHATINFLRLAYPSLKPTNDWKRGNIQLVELPPYAPKNFGKFLNNYKKNQNKGRDNNPIFVVRSVLSKNGACPLSFAVIFGGLSRLNNYGHLLAISGQMPNPSTWSGWTQEMKRMLEGESTLEEESTIAKYDDKKMLPTTPTLISPSSETSSIYLRLAYTVLQKLTHPEVPVLYQECLTDISSTDLKISYKGIGDFLSGCLPYFDRLSDTPDFVEILSQSLPIKPTSTYLVSYGMTAIVDSLMAFCLPLKTNANIICLTPSYFETLEILEYLSAHSGRVSLSKAEQPIFSGNGCEIMIGELHPNNAASEKAIHPFQFFDCLQGLDSLSPDAPRILIVDCTMNTLADRDLRELIESAQPYISSGKLALVAVQSLVKYTILGVDVATSGLISSWIPSTEHYAPFKETLDSICKTTSPSPGLQRFYGCLLEPQGIHLQSEYLKKIRQNTQYLLKQILQAFEDIGLSSKEFRAFDIHLNTDRLSCYLSIQFPVLFNWFPGLEKETCAQKILELFQTVIRLMGLRITNRMSFGFPFSNLAECGTALRLTLGIEDQNYLDAYAQVFGVMATMIQWIGEPTKTANTEGGLLDRIDAMKKHITAIFNGFELPDIALSEYTVVGLDDEEGDIIEDWVDIGTGVVKWNPKSTELILEREEQGPEPLPVINIGYQSFDLSNLYDQVAILLSLIETPTLLGEDGQNWKVTECRPLSFHSQSSFFDSNKDIVSIALKPYLTLKVPSKGPVLLEEEKGSAIKTLSLSENLLQIEGLQAVCPLIVTSSFEYPIFLKEMHAKDRAKFHLDVYSGLFTCTLREDSETGPPIFEISPRQETIELSIKDAPPISIDVKDGCIRIKYGEIWFDQDSIFLDRNPYTEHWPKANKKLLAPYTTEFFMEIDKSEYKDTSEISSLMPYPINIWQLIESLSNCQKLSIATLKVSNKRVLRIHPLPLPENRTEKVRKRGRNGSQLGADPGS